MTHIIYTWVLMLLDGKYIKHSYMDPLGLVAPGKSLEWVSILLGCC